MRGLHGRRREQSASVEEAFGLGTTSRGQRRPLELGNRLQIHERNRSQ